MELNNYHHQHMYDVCRQHMHSYVLAEMHDGRQIDGIITGLDGEHVYMAVPISYDDYMATGQMNYHNCDCQHYRNDGGGFGYGFSGYGGYGGFSPGYGTGYYPGYGYGSGYGYSSYGRPRRFNRMVLPLAALTAISALPWY